MLKLDRNTKQLLAFMAAEQLELEDVLQSIQKIAVCKRKAAKGDNNNRAAYWWESISELMGVAIDNASTASHMPSEDDQLLKPPLTSGHTTSRALS